MKAVYLLLILLCPTVLLDQVPDTNLRCPTSNPYLDQFRISIELYDRPLMINSHCQGEWDSYGTCCNPDTLLNHQQKDTELINAALQSVNNNLIKFKQALESIQLLIMQEAVMPADRVHPHIKEFQQKADCLTQDSRFKDYFKFITGLTKQEFDRFLADNTACWQEMIRARSAALCSTCSGRSNQFFEGKRGIISEEYCSAILQTCSAPLKILLNLVIGIHEFHPLLTQLTDLGINSNLNDNINSASSDKYTEAIKSSHILDAIKSFSSTQTPEVGPKLVLCGSFLHLGSTTFVEYISELFRGTIDPLQTTQQPDVKTHIETHSRTIFKRLVRRFPNYQNSHLIHKWNQRHAHLNRRHSKFINRYHWNHRNVHHGRSNRRRKRILVKLNISKAVKQAKKHLNVKGQSVTPINNWAATTPTFKIFDFTPTSSPILQGDVLIVPPQHQNPKARIDSSYSSYYGAMGSTSVHAAGLVFNLSKHFP
jgi:hypothetical protein